MDYFRSRLRPLILAVLLGAPAGAHELIPGAALEGFHSPAPPPSPSPPTGATSTPPARCPAAIL